MFLRKNKKIVIALLALVTAGLTVWQVQGAFGQNRNLYWGSSGADVTKVQSVLNRWGYYTGPIDGYYSGKTFRAVQEFQR
ncbi:MAG: peptidoglycan-binding domain-containing protein, partial [Bacillota bacterium]